MIYGNKLRHVLDMPHQDAYVYEHMRSKERRILTGKSIASHGLTKAWQLAKKKKPVKQKPTTD